MRRLAGLVVGDAHRVARAEIREGALAVMFVGKRAHRASQNEESRPAACANLAALRRR